MSFTSEVKNEVSKLETDNMEKISELSAMLQCNYYDDFKIKIITENNSVARRIYSLFKELFNVYPSVTIRRGYNYNRKILYILEVKQKVLEILKALGISGNVPLEFICDDEDLARAYLRGLFITCASINDPKTSRYHLEFNLDNLEYANFISNLLNKFNLNSKILHRESRYMVYVKGAEKIGDFLRMIGASRAVLYYEDIRIYRDHKNMTNRLNNCEQANVDRIIETSNNQVNDINLLKENDLFDLLGEKEMEAASYRLKYTDASLLELSEIISSETGNKITKSGLYHRFNKIKHMADKVREKN